MEIIKLTSRQRSGTGKSYTRKARVQGWVPAIYYGHDMESMPIEINAKEFSTVVRHKKTTHLFDLGLGDSKEESIAVIKDKQYHVIRTDEYLHIDFQHVAMNEKVSVKVPIELKGTPVGVKVNHGILDHPIKAIEIECLPMDIPEKVTIDVSALDIGKSIHVRDLTLEGITIKESPDEVLAVVTRPIVESSTEQSEGEEQASADAATSA